MPMGKHGILIYYLIFSSSYFLPLSENGGASASFEELNCVERAQSSKSKLMKVRLQFSVMKSYRKSLMATVSTQ